jgi:succinate-semialdehyde dehydrogenase/glutarate-semialdehyde dehydrogenase
VTESFFQSRNPYNDQFIESFPALAPNDADAALARADAAQRAWKATSLADRVSAIAAVADALGARLDELARTLALETGKPITQGRAEVTKCIALCRYYADVAVDRLAPSPLDIPAVNAVIRYEPIGVVLGVMPWNYPIWQTLRFAVPSLLVGNGVILKPAPNVVRTSIGIEEVLKQAGLPDQVFQMLLLTESDTLERIRDDPRIAAVTVTGSDRAGQAIAGAAGSALKKSVLELGGSDAFVVLDDADVDAAARAATASRTQNTGQSCIAAKRFIIHRQVAGDFLDRMEESMSAIRAGDPLADSTELGPLARGDVRDRLQAQVDASVDAGAHRRLGGRLPEGAGFGYLPTILTDVDPASPAWCEETFGPVAAVRVVADADEALALANASRYGLGASLWTADPERAAALVPRFEAGMVAVNDMVRSDPRIPFGGVKHSGYGRELGDWGLSEFANIKTVQTPSWSHDAR